MFDFYIIAFVTLFLIIDPIGLLPLFVTLTQGLERIRIGIALRAGIIGFFILLVFALFGETLLNFIGVSMPAFRISGGLLLFLMAVEMLFNKRSQRRKEQSHYDDMANDPSVFPLATPLIAGPGAMTAIILLVEEGQKISPYYYALGIVISATISVLLILFILFLLSNVFERILGKIGINLVTRLMGMLLAALSVQFVLDGLRDFGMING